ncbi:MAG: transcription antitermination protein [Haloarculaceae archaeon]
MDVTEHVRESHATALDRLGSEKSLLALTEARLETEAVLEAAGAALASARATLSDWAADAAGGVADALAAAAERLADAAGRVADSLDATLPGDSAFVSLAADTDAGRAGAGLVGLGLVLDRVFLQCVSFFVNEADTTRADLFRDLRGVADGLLETAADLDLDGEAAEEAAEAAGAVVEAAYDAYVDRLEAMGFDPKPIC